VLASSLSVIEDYAMPSRCSLFFLLLPALTILSSAQAQEVYKSVDAKGNVIYSDTPPANAAATEEVELTPGPSKEEIAEAQNRGREFQASVDKMVEERKQKEAALAEKRRLQEERRLNQEMEDRLARLEELEQRQSYRNWGAYYPPIWGGGPDYPDYPGHRPGIPEHPIAKPLPGLPPVTGLDGAPMFKSRSPSRAGRY
jgi:Skp family chaperone for outer membrane proteins